LIVLTHSSSHTTSLAVLHLCAVCKCVVVCYFCRFFRIRRQEWGCTSETIS